MLVTEDLRHTFTFDRPKSVNRLMANWAKGVLQDRVAFKALAKGFRHEQVNPAYGSQACPECDFVDANNRSGDRFVCLHCGYVDHSDRVGAMNTMSRLGDREITRYTPYREVKTILLNRFHRRLESEGRTPLTVTVPGRTLDTAQPLPQVVARRKPQRGNSAVNQRAKHNETLLSREYHV